MSFVKSIPVLFYGLCGAFLKESGGRTFYKFGLAAGGAIAEMHPFADCYGFFISYVINVLGGFGVKKDFCESA